MSDITAGPDYLARVLEAAVDEDGANIGETPRSILEIAGEKLRDARIEARRRVGRGKGKAVKVTTVITIVDTVTPGNGDAARLEEPAIDITVKMSKPAPYKGKAGWIDSEGNQIGKVEKQTTLAAVDGGKSIAAAKAAKERKAAV